MFLVNSMSDELILLIFNVKVIQLWVLTFDPYLIVGLELCEFKYYYT